MLIFFDCGIWRYVEPDKVAIVEPSKSGRGNYEEHCEPFPFIQIYAKQTSHNKQLPKSSRRIFLDYPNEKDLEEFSDRRLIEHLLKPKPSGRSAIMLMVATNSTVK